MGLQAEYIEKLIAADTRADKRTLNAGRDITIETGIVQNAEGSARVRLGKTEVIAGIKMDVGEPFPDKPNEGVLIVSAELSPIASPHFEPGQPNEESIELARVVDRGIRESKAIDTKKLMIKEKEKVWMVYVDIQIMNHDGNLIDAAGIAAIAALLTTEMPEYDGEKVVPEKRTGKLPLVCKPVPVTFAKINGKLVIDPSFEEENAMGARLTVTTKDDGNICALQKGGTEPLTLNEITTAFDLSIKQGAHIRKKL